MFDFQVEVIEQSHTLPVLVDFWAEWCAPCRMLGPVLEKLAAKYTGSWRLVKINTGEFPELAERYQVRGIPDVKLFVAGEAVDGFSGALSEYQIEQWLKKAVPDPYARTVALAETLLAEGRKVDAKRLLEDVLRESPDNLQALALQARILLFCEPEEALRLITLLNDEPDYAELSETVRVIGRLLMQEEANFADSPVKDSYLAAIAAIRSEHYDEAIEQFIQVLREDRYYDDDGSRKACIALFRYLGQEHPVTLRHRRAFDRSF
ncbi:Thioredoxin domain [Chlorobium phaeobacteroides DSM 266]|uniref:Thioredoxin domain n=2 Tax=Chlorobium phaeobacteroides TaxID=1096 RepID=A1BF49_CHLPD|nr:Thioredoxin domain [Chlorobium phaeobacteroides DSM 266]